MKEKYIFLNCFSVGAFQRPLYHEPDIPSFFLFLSVYFSYFLAKVKEKRKWSSDL